MIQFDSPLYKCQDTTATLGLLLAEFDEHDVTAAGDPRTYRTLTRCPDVLFSFYSALNVHKRMTWKLIRTIYFGIFTVQFNTNDINEHVQCTVELAVITSHRHNTPASTHHYSYNKKLQALWECVDLLTVLMPIDRLHGSVVVIIINSIPQQIDCTRQADIYMSSLDSRYGTFHMARRVLYKQCCAH